jgi:hypothetical protein
MTFTNKNNNKPKSLTFKNTTKNINFIVHGQGVFIFQNKENEELSFNIYNNDKSDGLTIKITDKIVIEQISTHELFIDHDNISGISNKNGVYYWFSLDSQNQILQLGIGEARVDNVLYFYSFDEDENKWKSFIESLVTIEIDNEIITPLKLLRDPITTSVSLLVKNTDELSMNDIASGQYLPTAFLSQTNQKLYNCISGKNFVLNSDDFPDFSKAIEYSIKTPGCWCYEKLQSKSREFNPDKPNILETYLRITLNQNNGESPGIPYVMEIWPVGHFSPVHNHSDANAIIRVLHGSINVSLFSFLCADPEGIKPFGIMNFNTNDITWISPTLNQTHQLKNLEDNVDTCITIQCYMYDSEDNNHYDYFDYIDSDGKKQQYEPDSDMDFMDFKELMKNEWKNKKSNENLLFKSIVNIKNYLKLFL